MQTFRFLEFSVSQDSRDFYKEILSVLKTVQDYSLKDQLRRAVLSVMLNLAEGSAIKLDREFSRFIQLSLGSINEVVACLDVLAFTDQINPERLQRLYQESESIAKQLGGLFKKLTVNS